MNIKSWIIIGLLAIIAFLIFKNCKNTQPSNDAYAKVMKRVNTFLQDSARIVEENKRLKHEVAQSELLVADLVADRDLMQGGLIDKSDESARLSKEVMKLRADKDTIHLIEKCDSLATVAGSLNIEIKALKQKNNDLEAAHANQVKALQKQSDLWHQSYQDCKSVVVDIKTELPNLKPKGKIYIDITAMTGLLTAAGGGLGYMDKNGRMISADVLISGLGPIYQLSVSVPLSLKRK